MSNAIHTLAATKAIKKAEADAARDAVATGKDQPVDFWVHVTGVVSVGEDYDQKIVAKADPWALLSVAMSKLNGVTVDALVREADSIASCSVTDIKKSAKNAIGEIKTATVTTCRGKVTTDLTTEIFESAVPASVSE